MTRPKQDYAYLFDGVKAQQLTEARMLARSRRPRLTYDCMNAIVQGDVVQCKLDHKIRSIGKRAGGGLLLPSVLKGISSSACAKCPDYDGETTE